jgi:hypothetical protein
VPASRNPDSRYADRMPPVPVGSDGPDLLWPMVLSLLLSGFSRREIGTCAVVIHCPHGSSTPDMSMPLGIVSLQELTFRHLSPTTVLNSVGKSRIGISRFPLSCARDFQFPDPRLCGISRHVSLLTDGSDPVGKSRIAIPTCKSFLPLETPILLLMSDLSRSIG